MPDQPQQLILKALGGVLAEVHLHLVGGVPNAAGHAVIVIGFDEKLPSVLSFGQNVFFLHPFVRFQQISGAFIAIISLNVPPFRSLGTVENVPSLIGEKRGCLRNCFDGKMKKLRDAA